jgi:hypothetical protein
LRLALGAAAVPKWFHDQAAARNNKRFLNAEIIRAQTGTAEAERRRQLGALRRDLDRFAASLPAQEDSAPLIREHRER